MPEVIVLDTHIWYWWINLEHHRLPSGLIQSIENAPRVGVSAELALAHQRGRLELPVPPLDWFARALEGSDVDLLPLTPEIAQRAVHLADIHRRCCDEWRTPAADVCRPQRFGQEHDQGGDSPGVAWGVYQSAP